MKRKTLRRLLVVICVASVAATFALFDCAPAGAPACNALNNCCNTGAVPDPSSCSETALSGEQTDAQCGMTLEMYVAQGICTVNGGTPPSDAATQ